MIREICKNEAFLAQKAEPATADDLVVAQDLLETLAAHKDGCVGMAANMIGVNKRIIAFDNDGEYMVMFNPVIVKQSGAYEAEEGCPSPVHGERSVSRPSRCNGRTRSSRHGSRPLLAGRRRLSSTRSTIAKGSSYEEKDKNHPVRVPGGPSPLWDRRLCLCVSNLMIPIRSFLSVSSNNCIIRLTKKTERAY